ncbi:MAG: hypothetical protein ACLP0J_22060 [Solirubrobacteraceae bacterium]
MSYGFRPGRRAQDTIEQVRFFIHAPRSCEWVIEGDVEDCFRQIHQDSSKRRISIMTPASWRRTRSPSVA